MNRNVFFSNNIYIHKSFLNASKGRFGKSFPSLVSTFFLITFGIFPTKISLTFPLNTQSDKEQVYIGKLTNEFCTVHHDLGRH